MTSTDDTLHLNPTDSAADTARQRIAALNDYQPVRTDLLSLVGTSLNNVTQTVEELIATTNAPAVTATALPAQPASPATQTTQTNQMTPSRLKPLLNAAIFFMATFALFKSPVLISQLGYRFNPPKAPAAPVVTVANTSESTLTIPRLNVNAPIIYQDSIAEADIQRSLQDGVVHYSTTAKPGQPGNAVIVGHSSNDWWEPGNYKFVFVLLDKLVAGDKVSLSYAGKYYVYEVYESKVVEPTDLTVLAQTPGHNLTLLTCTPAGTNWRRLIVRAKQISPTPQNDSQIAQGNVQGGQLLPGSAPGIGSQLSRFWQNLTKVFD
jgi:LPXTG-site transpeptidase (sortase) family protein